MVLWIARNWKLRNIQNWLIGEKFFIYDFNPADAESEEESDDEEEGVESEGNGSGR